MNLYEKLATIQQELIAPKNQYNSYGKYNYRSCEDILEGLKPFMSKLKVILKITDELVYIGERYYIKATASLIDVESEAVISNTAYAREEENVKGMSLAQITGSTSTYARKYALNGLFCIDDVKDADSRDNRQAEQKKAEEKKIENSVIDEVKVKALLARCEKDGVEPAKITKLYKVSSIADLTEVMYCNINEHWEEIKKVK